MAGIKSPIFGGGAGGQRNGSGEYRWYKFGADAFTFVFEKIKECDGKDDASGDSGSDFEGFQ